MRSGEHLILFGASVRAAAASALRAGLQPWCADLFADVDLRAVAPAQRLPGKYPPGFIELAERAPPGPWMYTGGLENWPSVVDAIADKRPLWGNGGEILRQVRSPERVVQVLRERDVPCPKLGRPDDTGIKQRRWLVKPRRGAGGRGIRFFDGNWSTLRHGLYVQELVEGTPCAAVYLGFRGTADLLGVTGQWVGQPWLHAPAFRYCGSIGPLFWDQPIRGAFARLGEALAEGFDLRGLFGVDCVVRDGLPWPVEINPRYPASVEVLELATGMSVLARHRGVFEGGPAPGRAEFAGRMVGKAILYAACRLRFPSRGPWTASPERFADIPAAGQIIRAGQPILTCFAQTEYSPVSFTVCLNSLSERTREVDACLYGASQ